MALMGLKHAPTEGATNSYTNKTMVGNWWEDRHMPQDVKLGDTTERVFPRGDTSGTHGATSAHYQTTKTSAEQHMLRCRADVQTPRKPTLYPSEQALKERLDTYMPGGVPPAEVAYTLGRTAVHSAAPPERFLLTTNQALFQAPVQRTAVDKTHFRRATGITTAAPEEAESAQYKHSGGRGGQRGEVTRHPREGGNPYGVSVFVDEYAAWGRKLAEHTTQGK